ncbi:MAG: hypothetical protein JETT_3358 [Candidatus Jettenia ecosi]|uniref:Uncharacterized protein n=1 Tax=Candidatus Jettenia ecosi TaxID=2494326 RepID=A0A533Q882_9BACT|nr:MAG: hypothetical protein JETT_3358 [Candidatus Jettenia ecosi]
MTRKTWEWQMKQGDERKHVGMTEKHLGDDTLPGKIHVIFSKINQNLWILVKIS